MGGMSFTAIHPSKPASRPLDVLIISQYFWPENFRINDLVAGLTGRGHHVTVLTGLPNYPTGNFFDGYGLNGPWRERHFGAEIVRVALLSRGRGKGLRLFLNYLSFVATGIWGALFRLRGSFDAIFVFEPSPITVAIPAIVARRRFRAPILLWVLDLWPESLSATGAVRSALVLRVVRRVVNWIYGNCARVLVQSQAFIPRLRGCVDASRIRYFPNWVEAELLNREGGQEDVELPALPEGFRVVYAGNIGSAQGFGAILDAVELLRSRPDIKWIIVGDGREAEWLRDEVGRRRMGSHVYMLGQYPLRSMPRLFAAADALLVSLRSDPLFALTIPGKLQSYLASGRPVLAMLDGEGARIVQEGNAGLACSAGDAEGLARNVLALASMRPDQREQMGENGRRYCAAHFDREVLFDRIEDWIEEAAMEEATQ